MKLTKIEHSEIELPSDIKAALSGIPVYDSSSSPEARVYFVDTSVGYFIKTAKGGTLYKESVMNDYFSSLGYSKKTVYYKTREKDILITEKIRGKDLTSPEYLKEPRRLAEMLGRSLRALHETPHKGCPIADRTSDYLGAVDEGYAIGRFDPSYIDRSLCITDAESAMRYISLRRDILDTDTLLHGDYCLPNLIYRDFALSGYIDLGGAGVGDRHIDLFWGAWTLNFNLGTDEYRDVFFDAYGRDLIDRERLLFVSVAEAFG